MATVRQATAEDVAFISTRLRADDIREVKASHGDNIKEALQMTIDSSILCWVAEDKEVFAIFGVACAPEAGVGVGIPWFLATDHFDKHSRQFIRECRKYVRIMNGIFPLLVNYVDIRNRTAIRWLSWCGFTFTRRKNKYGVEQRPFLEFVRYQ